MYSYRLSREGTDRGFFDNKYGYNTEDYNMPNCTDYSIKRSCEIANKSVKTEMFGKGATGNAKSWLSTCKWQNGKKIEEGCIVVYDGQYGHVLIVEKILERYSDTHCKCQISQSNYTRNPSTMDSNYFQSLVYDIEIGEVTKGVNLVAIGCIYNPYKDDKRVSRNKKHQVEITYDKLKIRDENGIFNGLYAPMGVYNVIDTEERIIDGKAYKCVKLDDNNWVALVDGCYVEYNETEVDYKQMYESALQDLKKIKAIVNKY